MYRFKKCIILFCLVTTWINCNMTVLSIKVKKLQLSFSKRQLKELADRWVILNFSFPEWNSVNSEIVKHMYEVCPYKLRLPSPLILFNTLSLRVLVVFCLKSTWHTRIGSWRLITGNGLSLACHGMEKLSLTRQFNTVPWHASVRGFATYYSDSDDRGIMLHGTVWLNKKIQGINKVTIVTSGDLHVPLSIPMW